MQRYLTGLAAFALVITGTVVPAVAETPSRTAVLAADIHVPEGFTAEMIAESVDPARHIAVRENGDVYLILQSRRDKDGIAAMRDTTGDGKMDTIRYFGDVAGTGLAIRGGYLYATSDTAVYRFPLASGSLVPGARETVVSGFPEQGQHAAKSIALDAHGNLFVNVGAPANACQKEGRTPGSPGMDPCPLLKAHGGIWRFRADETGQTFAAERRFATGLRNCVALEWDPGTESLYCVQHGRDQLHTLWPDMYSEKDNAELPAEEFLKITEGTVYGWPKTYYDGRQDRRMLAPEYGGGPDSPAPDGEYPEPLVIFPAHWAPNDLAFYHAEQFPGAYREGAFVAFHGSWNRAPLPQEGFNVAFVPFKDGRPTGDWWVFADTFREDESGDAGKEKAEDLPPWAPNAEYRPTGLAVGPDGALYVADSMEGTVWRIRYAGE